MKLVKIFLARIYNVLLVIVIWTVQVKVIKCCKFQGILENSKSFKVNIIQMRLQFGNAKIVKLK